MGTFGSSKVNKSTANYNTNNQQDNRQTDNKVAAGEGASVITAGGGTVTQGNTTYGNGATINATSDRAFDTVDRVIGQATFGIQQAADSVSKIAQDSNASIARVSETNGVNLSNLAKYIPYIVGGIVILGGVYLYMKKGK